MMIVPRKNFDLFDDFFDDPFFRGERGPRAPHGMQMMKTDIRENEESYTIEIDLPGFDKDNIKVDIEDGYLNINAKMEENNDEESGNNFIRRERFVGECSRSFYVGDNVTHEDIKGAFKNGVLTINVPKINEKKHEEKKYIEIGE